MKTIPELNEIQPDMTLVVAWIEALESGKYPQAHRYLHTRSGYCCLGVLCDVARIQKKVDGDWLWDDERHYANFRYEGRYGTTTRESSVLPPEIMSLVGLATVEGAISTNEADGDVYWMYDGDAVIDRVHTLTYANDGEEWTFLEIAAAARRAYGLPPREDSVNG